MWDLKKTLAGIAGARKREAKGLPPFTMTDEERARSNATHAEIRAALDARDKADGLPPRDWSKF